MKKRWHVWMLVGGVVIAGIIGSVVALVQLSPLRQSASEIQNHLLAEAPLGSSMDRVLTMIETHGWKIDELSEDHGFLDQRVRPPRDIGSKSIRAYLGHYQGFPWRTDVTVFWGFDEQSKLIGMWVWKDQDTL